MNLSKFSIEITVLACLTACGGGGGGSASNLTGNTSGSSGTIAVGAPLSGAVVTYLDKNGKTLSATAADDGTYTISDISRQRDHAV